MRAVTHNDRRALSAGALFRLKIAYVQGYMHAGKKVDASRGNVASWLWSAVVFCSTQQLTFFVSRAGVMTGSLICALSSLVDQRFRVPVTSTAGQRGSKNLSLP